jgi:DNA-binding transcriptional LysR family regulator
MTPADASGSGSGPLINWDDVRVFLAVAREGSLRAAGRALGLSQPTVGRRLATFEASFGGPALFDRLPEGLRLNAAGAALIEAAERLERAALALERRRAAASPVLNGTVRISVGEWASGFLAAHLAEESEMAPPVGITLELAESSETANLARRDADIALRHEIPEGGNLFVRKVGSIACAVYRRAHDAKGSRRRPGWIGYPEEMSHLITSRWIEQQGRAHGGKIVLRGSSLRVHLEAVRNGVGIAVLPCYAADADPVLERVSPPVAELAFDYWVIVHRDLRRAACVRAVIDWVQALFAHESDALAGIR